MAKFQWDATFDVGVAEFNDHHKKLIAYINELDDAMKAGRGKDVTGKLLQSLIDYTASHFSAEEKKMVTYKYPDYQKHKAEHDSLVKQVLEFQKGFTEGKVAISIEIMVFLKEWITKHILGTDKKYTAFFGGLGIK